MTHATQTVWPAKTQPPHVSVVTHLHFCFCKTNDVYYSANRTVFRVWQLDNVCTVKAHATCVTTIRMSVRLVCQTLQLQYGSGMAVLQRPPVL